jgi:dTDP-glucose pyrophosphorylase/CBS domain-containing protein
MISDLSLFCIRPERPIRQAIALIDQNEKGIVLVTDEEKRLLGTITDGDVRRAMLVGDTLETPLSRLLARKAGSKYSQPLTAPAGTERAALLQLMKDHELRHIPLVDASGHVAGLATLDDLLPDNVLPLQAVIMAGGFGVRLQPLTESMPKPMLPVGDRPLMELTLEQLRQAGIRRVNITTHYMPEKIIDHFGDGSNFGVELNYVNEDRPLGTAGALALLETPQEPLLIINGDILTRVDFRAMLNYHREQKAELTVAVRQYDIQVPYGILECEGFRVCQVREKPLLRFLANAGIYLMEPSVHSYIPNGRRYDMTDLIQRLITESRIVVSFPIIEYWLDIGQHADYSRAQADIKTFG